MVTVFVWSVLLYASETWCLTAEDTKNQAMEMWIWRRIKKTKWPDHVSKTKRCSKEWMNNNS